LLKNLKSHFKASEIVRFILKGPASHDPIQETIYTVKIKMLGIPPEVEPVSSSRECGILSIASFKLQWQKRIK
jgi:hypothetical protein